MSLSFTSCAQEVKKEDNYERNCHFAHYLNKESVSQIVINEWIKDVNLYLMNIVYAFFSGGAVVQLAKTDKVLF
jgi:hypothetical protein